MPSYSFSIYDGTMEYMYYIYLLSENFTQYIRDLSVKLLIEFIDTDGRILDP
jgi:hypothetical protein